MRPCVTLLLAAGLFLPALTLYAEKPPTDPDPAVLVERLGSDDFQQRQEAAASLERLGLAALPALRAARKNPDPEVRRGAAELLPFLERRAETARQLDAPRLRVHYKNTPLADVLADLSKRSGNPIKLATSADEELAKRPVTLDGDWTFWEALEQVCGAAHLAESEREAVAPAAPQIEEGFRGRANRRFFYLSSLRNERSAQDEAILLADEPPSRRSTFQAGALRIRMLGPKASCAIDGGSDKRYAPLTLEIKPEARIGWERVAALRIERVVDDKGTELPAPATVLGDTRLAELDENVVIIWDNRGEVPLPAAPQQFPIQFPVNHRTGTSLREVRGTVAGWIRTAPEPLVSIDDLGKALNEPQTGPDGCRLKVVQCEREDEGLYKVRIELTPPQNPQLAELLSRHIVRMNRRGIDKVTTDLDASTTPFELTGAKGERLTFVNGTCENDGFAPVRTYTMVYKPDSSDKGPTKLVYRDRRSAFVEVPFTLKDVPLYK